MPKMIDADKLLEWLKSMRGTGYWTDVIFDEVVKEVEAGTFDLTPPVQPDTLYKCPHCGGKDAANAWNVATAANYGALEITRIDEPGCVEASFTCPSCGSEEDYGLLEVITDEQR